MNCRESSHRCSPLRTAPYWMLLAAHQHWQPGWQALHQMHCCHLRVAPKSLSLQDTGQWGCYSCYHDVPQKPICSVLQLARWQVHDVWHIRITCPKEFQHIAIRTGGSQPFCEAQLILLRSCTQIKSAMQKQLCNLSPIFFLLSTILVLLIVLQEARCTVALASPHLAL